MPTPASSSTGFLAPVLRPATHTFGRLSLRSQVLCVGLSGLLGMGLAYQARSGLAAFGVLQFIAVLAAFGVRQTGMVRKLRDHLGLLCDGDMTHSEALPGQDELAQLSAGMLRLSQQLSVVVAHTRSEAQFIAMSADESVRNSQSLSQRTESQAASLEETRAGLQGLVQTVGRNTQNLHAAAHRATEVDRDTHDVQSSVQASVDSMRRIEQRSQQMGDIISAIDGIAFQTNILALNAAVEAARAGEAGRGFAVVAEEVRTLAQRSSQAAAEVKQLITGSIEEVSQGARSVDASRASLARAVEGVRDVADRLGDVARSSEEQNNGLQEIASAVEALDEITQRNAQMVESTVSGANGLHSRAMRLTDAVRSIRLRQGCADEARAMAERAVKFIDTAGPDEAVRQFHDPNGAFRDRDLYIVVADRDDYFRAFGSDPSKAGKTRSEAIPGDNQAAIRDATWRAVEAGGGWLEFMAKHPVTKQPVQKMGYVMPALGGRWAVQCSVNRGDGSASGSGSLWIKSERQP